MKFPIDVRTHEIRNKNYALFQQIREKKKGPTENIIFNIKVVASTHTFDMCFYKTEKIARTMWLKSGKETILTALKTVVFKCGLECLVWYGVWFDWSPKQSKLLKMKADGVHFANLCIKTLH